MRRMRSGGGGRRIRGIVVGVVTNIEDPEQLGRVRVRFPWLDDTIESNWARLVGWYGGGSRGQMVIPEIDDEVLIGFDNGDPNHPFILGSVWNGKHAVPGAGNPDGKNDHKHFISRSLHELEFLDTDGAEKIRLVGGKKNNSIVYDTPADTITTEAKTGSINILAPKGLIKMECVDLKIETEKERNLEVGEKHTVKVGQNRTVAVEELNFVQLAGDSLTVTTPQMITSTEQNAGFSTGTATINQGSMKASVGDWLEVQQGPVIRTVGMQKTTTFAFLSVNTEGKPSGTFTLTSGMHTSQAKGGLLYTGGPITIMGGMVKAAAGSLLVAKDLKGGKAALSTWMGGLMMLNPAGLTMPATKLLDPIVGMDFHTTLPAPIPPPAGPLPPLVMFPAPFMGPILIDFKPTVLINFRPAAGAGATALGVHIPPLPWPWPPITYRGLITSALMAMAVAPFNALLEMARAKMVGMASASSNPTFKRGFVADFIGSSHNDAPGTKVKSAGKTYSLSKKTAGGAKISFSRIFPQFSSGQKFMGFLASLAPLPVANAGVNISSPTVSVCDAPLGMMIPMGANSCSDVPIVPNASVVGFSNCLVGMSIGSFLGQLAWGAIQGVATAGVQSGMRKGGNAAARRIAKSKNPTLKNVAQKVNDFVGGQNCVSEGHPVDVASGTVFTESEDFTLQGPDTFGFRRFYNSRAVDPVGGDRGDLGPGWRHVLDQVLVADADEAGERTLALRDLEGRLLGFDHPPADGGEDFHPGERLTLTRVDGRSFEIEALDGTIRVFRFPGGEDQPTGEAYLPAPGAVAHLVAVRRFGRTQVRVLREASRLVGLIDGAGREVAFRHDRDGRLREARLIRSGGQSCDVFLAAYRYDPGGRLVEHTDANRNPARYRYDRHNRLVRETNRNGYSFHFHYDAADRCVRTYGDDNAFWCELEYIGETTRVKDALGGVSVYRFDADHRVTELQDPAGGVSVRTFTEEGWIASVSDPAGVLRQWSYDERGRLIEAVDGRGGKATVHFDDAGRPAGHTDALGNRWTVACDEAGRLVQRRSPMGREERFSRDPSGHVSVQTSPDGAEWRRLWRDDGLVAADEAPDGRRTDYEYDLLGRSTRAVERCQSGEERITEYRYDAAGRLTGVDHPDGRQERYTLDPEGNPIAIRVGRQRARRRYHGFSGMEEHIDPAGRATRIEYDLHRRPVALHAPGGRSWRWHRDRLGRPERVTLPDGGVHRYQYDPVGRPLLQMRPDGRAVRRRFDGNGNLIEIKWPDGARSRFRYDPLDRLVEASGDGDRPVKRSFDADGRLSTEVQGDECLRFSYDRAGRRSARSTSWGSRTRYRFDALDNLVGLVDPAGETHEYELDRWGRRSVWRQPGGVAHHTEWDAGHRMVREGFTRPGGGLAAERLLSWSPDGEISSVELREPGQRLRHRYEYDEVGRLTSWARDDTGGRGYRYDEADNLLEEPDCPARTFGDGDRIVSDAAGRTYRHSPGGELIGVRGPEGERRLWFDARGRLTRVHTEDDRVVHYEYDALDRRTRTVAEHATGVDEELLYWDGDVPARRLHRALGAEGGRDEEYVWDPEQNVPLLRHVRAGEGPGGVQCYRTDQRGAAVGLTDREGNVLWSGRYDPYGRLLREVGAEVGEQPLRLAGQLDDPATGLAHHRYRVFDPTTARFVSPDPTGFLSSYNLYAYPGDPIGLADPLGLASCQGRKISPDSPEYLEYRALRAQGYNASEAHGLMQQFQAGQNPDGAFSFHFTDTKGGRGIVDSGQIRSTKAGLAGSGVYAGTTPTPSWAQKHVPVTGWGIGKTPVRIPIKNGSRPARSPVLPRKTTIFEPTGTDSAGRPVIPLADGGG